MSELRRQHPYEFFTRGNAIRANVESVKRRRWEYTPRFTEFSIPGAVQDWLDVEFTQEVSSGAACSLRSRSYAPYSGARYQLSGWSTDTD